MTIGVRAGSESGIFKDSIANPTQALGADVVAGDLVVVVGCREAGGTDPPAAGDCTKSAGTATIDTPVLDHYFEMNIVNGPVWVQVGIWSCLVTGGGTLTMQLDAGSAVYWGSMSVGAYSGSWDATRKETQNGAGDASDTVTAASSGSVTPAGKALLIGALQSGRSDNQPITEDSANWALIAESEDGSAHAVGSVIRRIITATETRAAQWTLVTGHYGYAAAIVAYREAAAEFPLGSGSLAAIGHATLTGDTGAFTKFWRIPSNAPQGTTGRMIVFASGNPLTAVAYEGAVTADVNGFFDLLTSDQSADGTKRFAIVHAWNGVTGTTTIYGGNGISELFTL